MVFEKVRAVIADNKGMEEGDITMESTFEELGLDSLDTVELVMAFEDEFGITIEVEEGMKTVSDLVKLIEGLVNS